MSGDCVGKDEVARNKGNKKSTSLSYKSVGHQSREPVTVRGGGGGRKGVRFGEKERGHSGQRGLLTEGERNPAEEE